MAQTVFLDIDGVLNGYKTFEEWDEELSNPKSEVRDDFYGSLLDDKCVRIFNKIIQATNAHIVISSTWRYHIISGRMTLEEFTTMLRGRGVEGTICGHTGPFDGWHRGREIETYLILHPEIKESGYIVIDDDFTTLDSFNEETHLVLTKLSTGITDSNAEQAIRLLKSQLPLAAFGV
jgi:hypothetical protein